MGHIFYPLTDNRKTLPAHKEVQSGPDSDLYRLVSELLLIKSAKKMAEASATLPIHVRRALIQIALERK